MKKTVMLSVIFTLTSCAYQAGYFDDIKQAEELKKHSQAHGAAVQSSAPANAAAPANNSGAGSAAAAKAISPITH